MKTLELREDHSLLLDAMKILLVEDEEALLSSARTYLKSEGYICEEASTFAEGLEKINLYEYDCVVADIGLPGGSGLKLVQELKSKRPETGIIVISARNSLEDKITGLDVGADDYLTKPFHLSELNARLKSLLRRRKFRGNREIIFHEIKIVPDTLQVWVNDQALTLTRKEFDLLVYFIANKNKVLTKESIVEHLWGDYIDSVNSFDFIYNHVSNMRKKLIAAGAHDYVHTVYGMGYKFLDA
jgi:DNA-binding response OmpR family regulator